MEVFKAFTDDFIGGLEAAVEGRHKKDGNSTDTDY